MKGFKRLGKGTRNRPLRARSSWQSDARSGRWPRISLDRQVVESATRVCFDYARAIDLLYRILHGGLESWMKERDAIFLRSIWDG